MKRKILCGALAALVILTTGSAQAQLFDRGGGLFYDNVQNVTWLLRTPTMPKPVAMMPTA